MPGGAGSTKRKANQIAPNDDEQHRQHDEQQIAQSGSAQIWIASVSPRCDRRLLPSLNSHALQPMVSLPGPVPSTTQDE